MNKKKPIPPETREAIRGMLDLNMKIGTPEMRLVTFSVCQALNGAFDAEALPALLSCLKSFDDSTRLIREELRGILS